MSMIALGLLVSIVAAACATATPEPAPEPTDAPAVQPTDEPMEDEPTEEAMPESMLEGDPTGQTVVYWHPWRSGVQAETIETLVNEFNATNEYGVTVEHITQGSQSDVETAVNAAIATGEVPNLTAGFPNGLANWYGLGVIAPLNDFIADPVYGTDADVVKDIAPAAFAAGTLADGTQVGVPMHQSAQVIFYNHTWGQELGFDGPPQTSAEFKEQACAARAANDADDNPDNDGTGGFVFFPDASSVAPWIWAFGGEIVTADGSGYDLNSQAAVDVAMFFKDLIDSGCTISTPSFPNPEFADRLALFASSSTAGIPFQRSAFEEIASEDVWGATPFLGPEGDQFVDAFGQMIGVIQTNPDQDLASWLFIKWLTSPEIQSKWVQATQFFPSMTATDVGSLPTDDPVWADALALLPLGKAEPNLAAHGAVRGAIRSAYFAAVEAADEAGVIEILNALNDEAAALVAETQ
jgi:multiple sugar transport system substrate-binding protein/sn-glycerol 3-phosphate transport system substrate-binding protein